MRYRKISATGDYTLGGGIAAFHINTPDAVAQAVGTRLRLWYGEWFLDKTDGTNWQTGVLGRYTQSSRDSVIRERILGTIGVNSILTYSSNFDGDTRTFNVVVGLDTIYGVTPVQQLSLPTPGASTITL